MLIRYSPLMRRLFWITLFSLALAQSAYSRDSGSTVPLRQGDCCETLCHDMPGCATMLMCQTGPPADSITRVSALVFTENSQFAPPEHQRAPKGPVQRIWNPPD